MKSLQAVLCCVLLAAATLGSGGCQNPDSVETIRIGAMPPGTSWYVFAATLSGLLEQRLPAGTRVEVVARGGGVGNPILVDRGKETIALAQAASAAWAYNGDPEAYGGKKHPNICALAGGLNSVWMAAIVREAYIQKTGNDTLEKILQSNDPVRIVMKPRGSTVPVLVDMMFKTLGTSREKILANGGEIIQVTANQIPTILRDGRADVYFENAIQGHPTLTEVSTTMDVRFLAIPKAVLDAVAGPGVKVSPMPKWFRGESGPLESVDMGTVVIANRNLSDDLAYLITKTICESGAKMAEAQRAWADFDPARGGLLENTGVPLHPGAARYYKEKGWL